MFAFMIKSTLKCMSIYTADVISRQQVLAGLVLKLNLEEHSHALLDSKQLKT